MWTTAKDEKTKERRESTALLGLAYWEQKSRDSNERSGVGPSTHWPTYHKNRSNYLNRQAYHNQSRAFFVSTVRVSYLNLLKNPQTHPWT
jgi:hypothetical protein